MKERKIRLFNILHGENRYNGILLLIVFFTLILQLIIPGVTHYKKSNILYLTFDFGLNLELSTTGLYEFNHVAFNIIHAFVGVFKLISIIIIRNLLLNYDSYSIEKKKNLLIRSALFLITNSLIKFSFSNIFQGSYNIGENSISIFYFPTFLVALIILCVKNIQESKHEDGKDKMTQKLIKIICIASIVSVMIPAITIARNSLIFFPFGFYLYVSLDIFEITYSFSMIIFSVRILNFIPNIFLIILLLKFKSLTNDKLKILFKTCIAFLVTFPLISLFLVNILNPPPFSYYISFSIPSVNNYYYIPWISAIILGSTYNSIFKEERRLKKSTITFDIKSSKVESSKCNEEVSQDSKA